MVDWVLYQLVAAGAFVLTLGWLFIPYRLTVTTFTSAALWFWLAVTSGDVERTLALDASTTTVAVEIGSLGYLLVALGLLAVVAGVGTVEVPGTGGLYYPPDQPRDRERPS